MTEMLKGIAASDGVAVAKAYLLVQPDLSFETITVEDTNAEEARLDVALEASQNELSLIREKAVGTLGEEAAQVFDAHLMVLADPELIGQIKETIRAKKVNAEAGLKEVTDMFITIFEGMEDNPYMQERAADIRDVTKRVLANLLGKKLPNPASINEEVIVIAHDLTPSDTAQLDKNFVKAFVTNIGGRTSHSAIMALNPTEEQIAKFKAAGEAYAKQKAEWALLKDAKTVTADGKHFELAANIGTPKDVEGVNENGAEAVGLYRTEFLYMDSQDFPTEDDQYEAYKAVLEGMNGKPVVVRTMDIGGDKVRTAKAILEEEKAKLVAEGVAVADDIQVGIMIEIPAAAMLADQFAKEVDFFSIGTNDLIQYTMAADRMNEQVSYLYQPYNPSILRLINNVIKAAHAEGKWAGMCGEMAGDQTAVPLLVGMGLDEFSMSATSVLRTRSLMKKLDTAKMQEYANRALTECSTMEEVLELSKEYVNFD